MSLRLIPVPDEMKPAVEYLGVGDDLALEEQLVIKSHQPHILHNTPNDAKERFGSMAMIQERKAKGRQMYWLIGPRNDLAGVMWYGKKTFPQAAVELGMTEIPQETFGIRLYEGYTGRHLARPFMEMSLRAYAHDQQAHGEVVNGIWLITDTANEAALHTYTKFGYKKIFHDDKRAIMVLDTAAIAAYTR